MLNLFPRLRYRLRNGHWCTHRKWVGTRQPDAPHFRDFELVDTWGPWQMIDLGRRKMRRCTQCRHTEII